MQDYRSFAVVKPQLIQSIQCLLLDLLLEEALPVDDMFTWYYANTRIGIVTGHSQVHVFIILCTLFIIIIIIIITMLLLFFAI
jgi:hypothetical protein